MDERLAKILFENLKKLNEISLKAPISELRDILKPFRDLKEIFEILDFMKENGFESEKVDLKEYATKLGMDLMALLSNIDLK